MVARLSSNKRLSVRSSRAARFSIPAPWDQQCRSERVFVSHLDAPLLIIAGPSESGRVRWNCVRQGETILLGQSQHHAMPAAKAISYNTGQ
jgi:hypothetical protein